MRFAFFEHHGQTGAEGNLAALLDDELVDDAARRRFHFHRGLVGFDVGDGSADVHGVALLDVPLDKGALGHGVAELGHFDELGHGREKIEFGQD